MADHDVLLALRTGTADQHRAVEHTLDLLDPALSPARLTGVLHRMHGFWLAAEHGLDAWATAFPDDAEAVGWPNRRRAGLFAADLARLEAPPATASPALPALADTDGALGRMYVLEGSTLGGTFIDRHLTGLPDFAGLQLSAFTPYGTETGAMWAAFRRATRAHAAGGGDVAAMVRSARDTFTALADWCRPAVQPA
jgi:heme oxygenase